MTLAPGSDGLRDLFFSVGARKQLSFEDFFKDFPQNLILEESETHLVYDYLFIWCKDLGAVLCRVTGLCYFVSSF